MLNWIRDMLMLYWLPSGNIHPFLRGILMPHNKGGNGMKKKQQREIEPKGNRKEDLNRVRGTQRIYDPERGPANK